MSGTLWLIAAYSSIGIFIAGLALAVIRMARLPVHLRWELAPVPHDRAGSSYGGSYFEEPDWWTRPRERSMAYEISYMLKEIFLLHTVWKRHRRLWPLSMALHTGIYCLFFMVMCLAAAVLTDMVGFTLITGFLEGTAGVLGGAAYVFGFIGSAGLLILRIARRDLRTYSAVTAYLNLALLLMLFATGLAAMTAGGDPVGQIRDLIDAALHADRHIFFSWSGAAHVAAALFFLAILPFSSMKHFAMKFFTYHTVLWDDRPQDAATEREVTALLEQKVGWSAPHIGSGGTKNWVDAVKGE